MVQPMKHEANLSKYIMIYYRQGKCLMWYEVDSRPQLKEQIPKMIKDLSYKLQTFYFRIKFICKGEVF